MKKIFTFSFIFLLTVQAVGSATYDLIEEVGSSAESVGIANIMGFSKTASAIFENPASLVYIERMSVSYFATEPILGELTYRNFAAAIRTDFGLFSVGYMDLNIPENYVTASDDFGEYFVIDTFTYRQALAKLAFQNSLNSRTHLGFSINFFETSLYDLKGTSVNLDLGILVESEKITFSAVAKNVLFFQDVEYSNGKIETAATQFVGAFKYALNENFSALTELKARFNDNDLLTSYALQYRPFKELLILSVGRKEFYVLSDIEDSLTFGASIRLGGISLGFAYEKSDYFEQEGQQYVSFGINL